MYILIVTFKYDNYNCVLDCDCNERCNWWIWLWGSNFCSRRKFQFLFRVFKGRCNLSLESSAFLPSMRGFKLASLNIASLPQHIDELRVLLSDNPLDILSINETRLDDSVSDDKVYISGYDIVRRDREHNGRFGGGVCIYVRSNINFSLRPDLRKHTHRNS